MKIETGVSLDNLTTLKIGGKASYFALVRTDDELREAVLFAKERKIPWMILGGGSNILVCDEGYEGLVIRLDLRGIEFIDKGESVLARVSAGESWDAFALLCVSRGLHGLENLSGIPGTVGAAPVQNIGAYGVEVKDSIREVEVLDAEKLERRTFSNAECAFGYRDSVFKKPEGKKYIITRVVFELKKAAPFSLSYKDISNYFSSHEKTPTLEAVREAVIEIRKGKFPDLMTHGTAGSFFKNPIIGKSRYEELRADYPAMPHFEVDPDRVKIPLAWVLDNVCNMKGVRKGNVGAYEKQALVLVNWGGATAADVKRYAEEITAAVREKTGITIEPEVQYI